MCNDFTRSRRRVQLFTWLLSGVLTSLLLVPRVVADDTRQEFGEFLSATQQSREWFDEPIGFVGKRTSISGRSEWNVGFAHGPFWVVGIASAKPRLGVSEIEQSLLAHCTWIAVRNNDYAAVISKNEKNRWTVDSLEQVTKQVQTHYPPLLSARLYDEKSTPLEEVLDNRRFSISGLRLDQTLGVLLLEGKLKSIDVLLEIDASNGLVKRRKFKDDLAETLVDTSIQVERFEDSRRIDVDVVSIQNYHDPVQDYSASYELHQFPGIPAQLLRLSAYGLPEPAFQKDAAFPYTFVFASLGIFGLGLAVWLKAKASS